jgi:hypothetical protein
MERDIRLGELEQLYDEIDAEIRMNGLPTEKKLAAEIEELNKGTSEKHPADRAS